MFSKHFLLKMEMMRERVSSFDDYPFSLPVVSGFKELEFHPAVTFFVGENGSGKSTLLEAIAIASGFNAEGGSKNFNFATRVSHSCLHEYLTMSRGVKKPSDGYFLRAESFFNVATHVENLGVTGYGDRLLHEQSHGESFWSLLMNRFRGKGLYILDEPEAALSPQRQLAMLVRMHDLIREGSQFIIATHSPIIMAYPDAVILQLSESGLEPVAYEDTDHYRVTQRFLNDPARTLSQLLDD